MGACCALNYDILITKNKQTKTPNCLYVINVFSMYNVSIFLCSNDTELKAFDALISFFLFVLGQWCPFDKNTGPTFPPGRSVIKSRARCDQGLRGVGKGMSLPEGNVHEILA